MDARVIALAAWLGAAFLHGFVPRAPVALEPPSAPVLAALSGGHRSAAASAAWSATVLHYANTTPDPDRLERGIRTAAALDPTLQPPLVHGTLMLRRAGGADRVAPLLDLGMQRWPAEPWFPWARGMYSWLDDGDPESAAAWLDRADALEPTPVYRAAARALREAR